MNTPHPPFHARTAFPREQVMAVGLWLELALLALAGVWAFHARLDLRDALAFPPSAGLWALLGAGAIVGGNAVLLMASFLLDWEQPQLWLRELFIPLFRELCWWDILLLSAAAGFCEEVFFRGVMQEVWGWGWAALVFGLAHFPSGRHWLLGVWAAVMGGWLGWIYQQSGSLWAPVLAHAIYDGAALAYIRYVEVAREHARQLRARERDEG